MKSSRRFLTFAAAAILVAGASQGFAQTDAPQINQPVKVSAPTAPGNALAFETVTKDYGMISEGEVVDIVFPVTNKSDKRVNITKIQVSCGCTKAADNPEFIEPGQTVDIKVQYNSAGRPGQSTKSVTIFTDEGEGGGLYQLSFTGQARQINYLSERSLAFGEVQNGAGATKVVDFISLSEPPVKINTVTIGEKDFEVVVGETVTDTIDGKPGTRTPITVTIPKSYPVRSFNTVLMVDTDDTKRPRVTAPVSGNIAGRFIATPRRIQMGRMNPGDVIDRETSVVFKDKQPFEIKSVSMGDQASRFTVTERDGKEPGSKVLVVNFKAPDNMGVFSGVVEVVAKAGDYEETLKIPVTAQVMGPQDQQGPQRPGAMAPRQTSQGAPARQAPKAAAGAAKEAEKDAAKEASKEAAKAANP